jgi:hypothetical protein
MNTVQNRIDQSVKFLNENEETPMKNANHSVPLFPISTAEKLKSALVKKFTSEYAAVAARLVYQAVNEAYALVALTPEPLLLLPVLAEEKVQSAAAWTAHQRSLRRSDPFALAA